MEKSWKDAQRVAVIGAGTMGGGIAAHLANLGFSVTLFDVTRDGAQAGLERAQRMKPPHFYSQEAVDRITLASTQDELDKVADADWVCEAILEDLSAKRELYALLESSLSPNSMVSTNTSCLKVAELAEGRSDSFKNRFFGTHFFNPPRHLKLVELIPTADTDTQAVEMMAAFLEDRVGKRVVVAKDTPGFIANRYGMWALYQAIHTAEKLGFNIETTDAISGAFLGRPKTATFRLSDLIGIDIMENVASNLRERCSYDPRCAVLSPPATVSRLLDQGWLGAKSARGYYRRESKDFLVLDLTTNAYRPQQEPNIPGLKELSKVLLPERLRAALGQVGEIGEFVREHLAPTLEYAGEIAGEVSAGVNAFDRVMKWGWGWELGPFELIDAIGYAQLKPFWKGRPLEEKAPFYLDRTALEFSSMSHQQRPLDKRFKTVADYAVHRAGNGWVLREDGDGGFIFQFNTKMNAVNPEVINALLEHLQSHPDESITLLNNGPGFSAGFDLPAFLKVAEEGRFEEAREWLKLLQACGNALSRAKSCAGLHGFALGGGLELAMHCRHVVSQPEALLGLPEVSVGVIPSGGGVTILRKRSQHDIHALADAAMTLATGKKVPAHAAERAMFLRPSDHLCNNPDQLAYTAVTARSEAAQEGDWLPAPAPLAGMIEAEITRSRSRGELSDYGVTLAGEVKHIFVKAKSEQEALQMEVEGFLRLLGKPQTAARMKHFLETGKPLSN